MRNPTGFTLELVLGAMILFTALGLGAMHYATMRGQTAANQKLSTQAFWLAEAGVQKAVSQLPITIPVSGSLSTGSFQATITNPYNGQSTQYLIVSKGTSNNYSRTIWAVYNLVPAGNYFSNAHDRSTIGGTTGCFTTTVDTTWSLLQTDPVAAFQQVFEFPMPTFGHLEGFTAINSNDTSTLLSPGVYYVTPPSGTLTWAGTTISGPSVLFVQGNFIIPQGSGGSFPGIIWVTGNFTRGSNSTIISGAVFVEGNASSNTGQGGCQEHMSFDLADADAALVAAQTASGTVVPAGTPTIVSWQE